MKRTILFLLVAVLSVATMTAQNVQKASYVIDGKPVENFDGSQLNGKTIVNYTIEPESNVHVILTSEYEASHGKVGGVKILSTNNNIKADKSTVHVTTSEVISADNEKDIVFILNDKATPFAEIQSLSPSQIDTMKVIKDKKDPDYIKYAKKLGYEPKSMVKITTK